MKIIGECPGCRESKLYDTDRFVDLEGEAVRVCRYCVADYLKGGVNGRPESSVYDQPPSTGKPPSPILTTYEPPPIPLRQFDWSAIRDGYEPGCGQIGWGRTEEEAIAELREKEALEED